MIKKSIFILLVFIAFTSCKKEIVKEIVTKKEIPQISTVKTVTYNELKPLLEKEDGKTYIINFWATWCAPCVKELPYFEKIKEEYADNNVEVLLVSLDFPKQVEKWQEAGDFPFIKHFPYLIQTIGKADLYKWQNMSEDGLKKDTRAPFNDVFEFVD